MHDFQETVKFTGGEWHLTHSEVKTFLVDSLLQQCVCFFFKQCTIEQLFDPVFVISGIIKVSVIVTSFSLRLRLITMTETLIILGITKPSSNKCL